MGVKILDVGLVVQEFAPEGEKLVKMGEAAVFLNFLLHLEESGEERHLDLKMDPSGILKRRSIVLVLAAH